MIRVVSVVASLLAALRRDDRAARSLAGAVRDVRKLVEKVAGDVERHEDEINALKAAAARKPNRFKLD